MIDESDSDPELERSMGAFEGALRARRQTLPPVEVQRVLAVLDGSNQDLASARLAIAAAARLKAELVAVAPWDAAEPGAREALEAAGAQRSEARLEGHLARRMSALCRELRCGLVVACAPLREDYVELGEASVGTEVDLLLRERPVPLLLAREPRADVARALDALVLPLGLLGGAAARAGAWALRLVPPDGALHLLAWIDDEALDELRERAGRALEELDEETLAGLRAPAAAGLIATLQQAAAERGLACRVEVRHGPGVAGIAERAAELEALVLTGCPESCSAAGFARAQALLRHSRWPLLVL